MKKNIKLLLVLLAGVAIGLVATRLPRKESVSSGAMFDSRRSQTDGAALSPIVFWPDYARWQKSIELRFDGQVAFVDGEVVRDSDLEATIARKKAAKQIRFLAVVIEDTDRFGALIDRIDRFRKLGFDSVVLVANHDWAHDSTLRRPNQSLEPTSMLGTSAAEQPLVPSTLVAHL